MDCVNGLKLLYNGCFDYWEYNLVGIYFLKCRFGNEFVCFFVVKVIIVQFIIIEGLFKDFLKVYFYFGFFDVFFRINFFYVEMDEFGSGINCKQKLNCL